MKLYSTIRGSLSTKNQGRISKFLVNSGIKPSYRRAVKSPFNTGIIIFSADFEMAWAFRYSKTLRSNAVEIGLKERQHVPILLALFDQYQIPVTWATVGHLFLNECKKDTHGAAHPDMPRPGYFEDRNWIFKSGDWYEHDPGTGVLNDPAWYAPDLIDKILFSGTKHEIGCHTFSHIGFANENCPKLTADAELDACIRLADNKGLRLKSMVFPGGTLGNFKSLKVRGFLCYRKPMKYHIDLPYIDSYGLVAIPSSMGLDKDPYRWSKEFHLKMVNKFIEETARHKLVCHFWFHPSMDSWYLENVMPEVLKMVAEYRSQGRIEVSTMGKLAEEIIRINL